MYFSCFQAFIFFKCTIMWDINMHLVGEIAGLNALLIRVCTCTSKNTFHCPCCAKTCIFLCFQAFIFFKCTIMRDINMRLVGEIAGSNALLIRVFICTLKIHYIACCAKTCIFHVFKPSFFSNAQLCRTFTYIWLVK
jgi:hypothetical protein